MNKRIPCIVSIIYIFFISLFALDSFGTEFSFMVQLQTFFIHLIPSFIVLSLVVVSRKKEKLGGALFISASVVATIFFQTYQFILSFLILTLPLFIIGLLFINSKKEI